MPVQHIYKSSPDGGDLFYSWFSAMHTRVDLVMHGNRCEEDWLRMANEIYDEILRLELVGNCFDEKSELAQVNAHAFRRPMKLSDDLYEMLSVCMDFHAKTLGCFDITVQSRSYHPRMVEHLCLDRDAHTLSFTSPDVFINLSGFIKGFALDKIKAILLGQGVDNALVNLGNSSIMALGHHPFGDGWKLDDDVVLHNQCLTVSGNDTAERKHILSPQTGQWVTGCGKVSVVTASGAIGEILSTALFAAGDGLREKLLERLEEYIVSCKF